MRVFQSLSSQIFENAKNLQKELLGQRREAKRLKKIIKKKNQFVYTKTADSVQGAL